MENQEPIAPPCEVIPPSENEQKPALLVRSNAFDLDEPLAACPGEPADGYVLFEEWCAVEPEDRRGWFRRKARQLDTDVATLRDVAKTWKWTERLEAETLRTVDECVARRERTIERHVDRLIGVGGESIDALQAIALHYKTSPNLASLDEATKLLKELGAFYRNLRPQRGGEGSPDGPAFTLERQRVTMTSGGLAKALDTLNQHASTEAVTEAVARLEAALSEPATVDAESS